jgi:hypothetical protein
MKPAKLKKPTYVGTVRDVLPQAWAHASGDGALPAMMRQIYYAARPLIIARGIAADKCAYKEFTETVRKYLNDNNPGWNVLADARGTAHEPYRGLSVDLGTAAVRDYLITVNKPVAVFEPRLLRPFIKAYGPHVYDFVLYVEKEGFSEILQVSGLLDKYGVLLIAGKGYGVDASKRLIEQLVGRRKLPLAVLHDFDPDGMAIAATLMQNTRWFKFAPDVTIPLDYVDFGLRLNDIDELQIADNREPFAFDPRKTSYAAEELALRSHGASEDEIDFMFPSQDVTDGYRVELNAMTSPQFVAFVEAKLREAGAVRVAAPQEALKRAYSAYRAHADIVEQYGDEIEEMANAEYDMPDDLADRVADTMEANDDVSWIGAFERVMGESE